MCSSDLAIAGSRPQLALRRPSSGIYLTPRTKAGAGMHRVVGDSLRPSTCSGTSARRAAVLGFKLPEEMPSSASTASAHLMRLYACQGSEDDVFDSYAQQQQDGMAQLMQEQAAATTDYNGPSRLVRDMLLRARHPKVEEEPLIDMRTRLHYDDDNLKTLRYHQGVITTTYYDSALETRVKGARAPQMPVNLLAVVYDKFACVQEDTSRDRKSVV